MIEPIFKIKEQDPNSKYIGPAESKSMRNRALGFRAMTLAIESFFREEYHADFPVGAVVAQGNYVVGRGVARDRAYGIETLHAERMACYDQELSGSKAGYTKPDTLAVNVEPCGACIKFIGKISTIKRVVYSIPRSELENRGLVNPRPSIEDKAHELPFAVIKLEDAILRDTGLAILDSTKRDPESGIVTRDLEGLDRRLQDLVIG